MLFECAAITMICMISYFANKASLAEFVSIKAGYPMRGRIEQVQGTGVRAVRLKDVSLRDGIDWNACIETELTGRNSPQWLQPNDVLFAAHGSHNTATFIKESFKEAPFKAVATPMFFVLRVIDEASLPKVLPEYLAWFINAAPSQRYFEKNAEGSRTKSVRRQVLEGLEISIPVKEKQEKIIALAKNVNEQQKCLQQLAEFNEQTLNAIAQDLANATNEKNKLSPINQKS